MSNAALLLFREDLDGMLCRCGLPDCGRKAATIMPSCHPRAGLQAQYANGTVALSCKKCHALVVVIGVAVEPETIELSA